jgi:hypothetical protein
MTGDEKNEEEWPAIRASLISAPGFGSRPLFYRPGWKITVVRSATSEFVEDTALINFERSLAYGYCVGSG